MRATVKDGAAEIVIVGAGMAGLCAATAAAQCGADVLVLEADREVGGSMRMSGGLIWGPASEELARRWIPRGSPALQALLVGELAAGWEWLESLGMPLDPPVRCLKEEMGIGRLMGLGMSGDRTPWARALAGAAGDRGVTVALERKVTGLERDGAGWRVRWTGPGGEEARVVDAVVFCGGGFHNDRELVARYVTPHPEALVIRGNRCSDGVALRCALPLGAHLTHGMHSFYGHTLPRIDGKRWDGGREFLAGSMYFSDFCLIVNDRGLRFTDESVGCIDEHNAQRGCREAGGRYFLLFDDRIRAAHVDSATTGIAGLDEATGFAERMTMLRKLGASIVSAPDAAGLAAAMEDAFGVPAVNVLDSLRTYNEAVDPVGELDPPRRRDHAPLTAPPLTAIECVAGITYTMGGLQVDSDMRVLGLGGVHAAGADAGNVFEDTYGGGLGWALVSGRRAGTSAAATAATTERVHVGG